MPLIWDKRFPWIDIFQSPRVSISMNLSGNMDTVPGEHSFCFTILNKHNIFIVSDPLYLILNQTWKTAVFWPLRLIISSVPSGSWIKSPDFKRSMSRSALSQVSTPVWEQPISRLLSSGGRNFRRAWPATRLAASQWIITFQFFIEVLGIEEFCGWKLKLGL